MKQVNVSTNLPPGTPIRVTAKADYSEARFASSFWNTDASGRFDIRFSDDTPAGGADFDLLAAGYALYNSRLNVPKDPGSSEATTGDPAVPLGVLQLAKEPPNPFA